MDDGVIGELGVDVLTSVSHIQEPVQILRHHVEGQDVLD
jgi:hypothetical protein